MILDKFLTGDNSQGLSERQIAQRLGISRPAVAEYVRRAQAAGLSWPLPATCDVGTLERLLFPSVSARAPTTHLVPDWATVHRELKHKGVTLFLLWQDYKAATPEPSLYGFASGRGASILWSLGSRVSGLSSSLGADRGG